MDGLGSCMYLKGFNQLSRFYLSFVAGLCASGRYCSQPEGISFLASL